ncbi:MAG: hypothetical protein KDD53_05750 [Bdellovibrionales bacterium]|nr:hypothetical protein [Bdellovibrionales bacterium]
MHRFVFSLINYSLLCLIVLNFQVNLGNCESLSSDPLPDGNGCFPSSVTAQSTVTHTEEAIYNVFIDLVNSPEFPNTLTHIGQDLCIGALKSLENQKSYHERVHGLAGCSVLYENSLNATFGSSAICSSQDGSYIESFVAQITMNYIPGSGAPEIPGPKTYSHESESFPDLDTPVILTIMGNCSLTQNYKVCCPGDEDSSSTYISADDYKSVISNPL